jgi:hypothetical protein
MKKVIILISIVVVLVCATAILVLTNQNKNVEISSNTAIPSNSSELPEDIKTADVDTVEIRGKKYKDINSVQVEKPSFDENLVYAESSMDYESVSKELYVKLSDDFFLNEKKKDKEIDKYEMIPARIYASDDSSYYLYTYKDETYFIPVTKCEPEEERIVYRDYDFEVIKKDDSIKIKDKIATDVISGWDLRNSDFSRIFDEELRFDDVSLCEAYMESWKISAKKQAFYDERDSHMDFEERMLEPQEFTKIYQVELDGMDTLEFAYTSMIADHVNIDSTYPYYSVIDYSNNGIRISDEGMLWFYNISNYRNVFFGYGPLELGQMIDNVILINENVITGYYIFDAAVGLIHVERFANGEKLDEKGFKKLSEVELTLEGSYFIQEETDGVKYIYTFPMYNRVYLMDENGEYLTDENGNPIEDPNAERIEAGTKIHIYHIDEDGYSYNFRTEDGTEYHINYSYT